MKIKGFTLIEVLIALSLMAILMTSLGSVLFQTFTNHADERLQQQEQTYYTLLKIEEDIENFRSGFKGDSQGFSFTRYIKVASIKEDEPMPKSGLELLSYKFEPHPQDGKTYLTRTAVDKLTNLNGKEPLTTYLIPVDDYSIKYLNDKKQWLNTWLNNKTPIAIKLTLGNDVETGWSRTFPIVVELK